MLRSALNMKRLLKIGAVLLIIVIGEVVAWRIGYLSNKQVIQPEIKEEATTSAQVKEELIRCNNPNCGPIVIPKDQCSDTSGYVCCQFSDTWIWYSSRERCSIDQSGGNQ